MDLSIIRAQLDDIDRDIVDLFQKRMALCGEVAHHKIETNKPVYDKAREAEKISAARAQVDTEFEKQAVEEIFTQLMAISRRYQYQLLEQNGKSIQTGFRPVPSLPMTGIKVVYQGVEGAYSHAATLQYFGDNVDAFHVKTWEDAMKAVEDGQADYAVIPIENSSAGAVSDNYDQLIKHSNVIVAEIQISVSHALLGLPGAAESDIQSVYSHPQALMQCSQYLNAHPQWRQISLENTAAAALKVTRDGDCRQAAVASEIAGRLYGLKVLAPGINHNKNNTTRFIVLSREAVYRKDASKVSICFEGLHRSGSLYNMLGNFIFNNVNMLMIESRPIEGRSWEYRFFVDVEGSLGDAAVQNALKGISEEAVSMRILGNY